MIIRIGLLTFICILLTSMTFMNDEKKIKEIVIEPKGVHKVELELVFVAGKLQISGGASQLMEGRFIYREKEPTIVYDPLGENGYLYMEQQNEASIKKRSIWEVLLNNQIPIDMHIATGASEAELDLTEMYLQKLFLESGVGDTIVHLNGDYHTGFDGWIHTGVGNTIIYLPQDIGVIVKVKQDRGKVKLDNFKEKERNVYVNEAYGQTDVIIDLEVTLGIGEVELILMDY